MNKSIQDQVIEDLEARKQVGLKEYGTLLYHDNNVDMLKELYEELLDAACYVKAVMQQRENLAEAVENYNKYPKLDIADWVALEAETLIGKKNES